MTRYEIRGPTPTPEQRDYTRSLGAFLAGRISEDTLRAAHARAYPGQHLARDKINLMRRLRRKISTHPQ